MTAARYWRICGISTGTPGPLSLTAAYLHGPGGRLDDTAALLTSTLPAIAGDASTLRGSGMEVVRFATADVSAPGFALVWDFGVPVEAAAVQWGGGLSAQEFVSRCDLQSSEDGRVWVQVQSTGAYIYPGLAALAQLDLQWYLYPELALLAHMNQPQDSSSNPKTLSLNGTAALTPGAGRFNAALVTSGGSGNFMSVTGDLTAFALRTRDFTLECFVYVQASGNTGDRALCLCSPTGGLSFGLIDGKLQFGVTNISYSVTSEQPVPTGRHVHVAVSRASGVLRLFVDGAVVATASVLYDYTVYSPISIGGRIDAAQTLNGRISELRFNPVRAIYTGAFSAPLEPFHQAFNALPVVCAPAHQALELGWSVLGNAVSAASRDAAGLDLQDGGIGRIYGTVSRKQTPANVPLRRRVRLFEQVSGRFIRETWSQLDGTYEFTQIKVGPEYCVIAFDHERQDFATVVDGQLAEFMP